MCDCRKNPLDCVSIQSRSGADPISRRKVNLFILHNSIKIGQVTSITKMTGSNERIIIWGGLPAQNAWLRTLESASPPGRLVGMVCSLTEYENFAHSKMRRTLEIAERISLTGAQLNFLLNRSPCIAFEISMKCFCRTWFGD